MKLGISQLEQCHEMLFSAIYTGVDICMQSASYTGDGAHTYTGYAANIRLG